MHYPADIVLCSSDKESFQSWKIFLSMSSPVFNDMFTLPQPDRADSGDVPRDELPVIDLEEDGRTVGHILSLCHPPSCSGKQFKPENISELAAVLQATAKYDMENVHAVVLQELSNPLLLREDPLKIYALACQHGCPEAARLAAKYTLALPRLMSKYLPELENIHAGQLCRLLLYREACATAARSLATDYTWIAAECARSSPLFGCSGGGTDEDLKWITVRIYMRESEHALRRWPHSDAVKDEKLVDPVLKAISASKCQDCQASQVSESFRSFVHDFAENIERCTAQVKIDLGI